MRYKTKGNLDISKVPVIDTIVFSESACIQEKENIMPYKFDLGNVSIDPYSLRLQWMGKSFEWMQEFQKAEAKNALRTLAINLDYIKETMQDIFAELMKEGIVVDVTENSISFTLLKEE